MQPWFTVYFLDIGHPCYDQLTPVNTWYPLTSITWPYRGLRFTAPRGHVFSWSWPLIKRWLSIGSRAHIGLACWKQGRIAWKPVYANPGLKVNRIITFSSIQMCFAVLFCVYGDYKNSKQKAKQYTETSPQNQNFTFFWVSLIGLWTTRPRSYAFRLA